MKMETRGGVSKNEKISKGRFLAVEDYDSSWTSSSGNRPAGGRDLGSLVASSESAMRRVDCRGLVADLPSLDEKTGEGEGAVEEGDEAERANVAGGRNQDLEA